MNEVSQPVTNIDVDMNPDYREASTRFQLRSADVEHKMVFFITAVTGGTLTLLCPLYFSGSVDGARRWVIFFMITMSSVSFLLSILTSINFGKYLDGRSVEYLKKGNADATLRELKKTVQTLSLSKRDIDENSKQQLLKQLDFIKVSTSESLDYESVANKAEEKSQSYFYKSVIVYFSGIIVSLIATFVLELLGIL